MMDSTAMGKITFYEKKDFKGRHFECDTDCEDLDNQLNCCNSIRVDSGCFMVYEHPNFSGHQFFLSQGEYADYNCWMGVNDCIRSCRVIPMTSSASNEKNSGSFNIRLYERIEFGGQMVDLMDDCPSVMDLFHMNDIFSCNVTKGHWLFYEEPDYRGRMYLIRPGEYKRFSEWGSRSARVGSIRRITDKAVQGPRSKESFYGIRLTVGQ